LSHFFLEGVTPAPTAAVYTYSMGRRTQVTLTDGQHAFLRRESARTGLSLAELVRRAVDATYALEERPRLRGFDLGFGIWRHPDAALAGRRAGPR
jgi:hypothetical protein